MKVVVTGNKGKTKSRDSTEGFSMHPDIVRKLNTLVMERGGFVNAHSHLDNAFTLDLPIVHRVSREKGFTTPHELGQLPLREKIDLLDVRLRTDKEFISTLVPRMERALLALFANHGRACRTTITVGSEIDVAVLDAAAEVKEKFRDRIHVQIVALQLRGILENSRERAIFERACRHPAVDVIGGLPQVESQHEKYFALLFEISAALSKGLEVHLDELLTPDEEETRIFAQIARAQRAQNYRLPLSIVHCVSLSAWPPDYRRQVAALLREANVGVIVCPRSAIGMRSLDRLSYLHNAIAPVTDLISEGVTVGLGTDNINDIYVPFSHGDLLEELDFLAEGTRIYDLPLLADIASTNGARIIGL